MLESLFVTLALCQQPQKNVRPEFTPNPPKRVERMDIFVEMIRRGDERADVNKDGKIDGKDLEMVLDRRMQRNRMDNRPQSRRGHGNRNRGGCGCSCKNK
jgi:hypothetical protein